MKLLVPALISLILAVSPLVVAEDSGPAAGTIQHVIIVIQENRTPDDLFATDSQLISAGANIWPAATQTGYTVACKQKPKNQIIQVTPQSLQLDACVDPQHGYQNGWLPIYDKGANDGLCNVKPADKGCTLQYPFFPQYSYVENTVQSNGSGILDPYFNVAKLYGFANYMFQTNQGPSYPAHQFLFSGTSAPDYYNDPNGNTCGEFPCWEWFVSENPALTNSQDAQAGCVTSTTGEYVYATNPNSAPETKQYTPPLTGAYPGYPCYDHPSMQDELAVGNKTWKYYAAFTTLPDASIWTAPNSLYRVCQPSGIGGTCTWPDYYKVVISPHTLQDDQAQILTDIENDTTCSKLANVSWVIPDGKWADHPTPKINDDGGPSWVAALVNAVGNENNCNYWSNTVILVTWDDWGGWYDHINPSAAMGGPGIGYNGQTGPTSGKQYVYGFRVPLLVVSAYTPEGYVSGANTSGPTCPGTTCHDFGSILGFVEHALNLPLGGIGPTEYPYADYYAPDGPNSACGAEKCPFPLKDFFTLTKPRAFQPITGVKYPESCFHHPGQTGCWPNSKPEAPDDDGDED